jgi:elongation factor Ts
MIKQLRERTGAPIVDVKRALDDCAYDEEAAYDALRAKGLAAAAKKASRVAADGLVGARVGSRGVAACEINAETDFVARNEEFQELVRGSADAIYERLGRDGAFAARAREVRHGKAYEASAEEASATTVAEETLDDFVKETAANVRENVTMRRAFVYALTEGSEEVIGAYVHGAISPGVGRQAAFVVAKGVSVDFANKVAMHVVASSPLYLRPDCVPKDAYEREMAVFRAQTADTGKPANIVEKILLGRMNKYFEEVCLENQKFILDDSMTVGKAVKAEGGELVAFARVKVGEGIEVETKDFAAEVAETVRST